MAEDRNMYGYGYGHGHEKPTYSKCEKYKYYHVLITLSDGASIDGIIVNVNDDGITVLVSEDVMVDDNGNEVESRQFNDYGYGYGRRRGRRFRRLAFPLAALASLALYPYYRPYSPYYPYY
ncbi:hypothetical protein MUO14_13595 [Halobacillus shinanisalinarum]|uniref:Uncharacterized protein n=1 Tax=Halobacillus shinanisalinarum TaxID=2932258 RepID=A0ABY4GW29_9BACI|nr:hypothetical protein [Halobacillus shinanisalinarum]UOQ91592.1 hypothetical protein MUO14_13595 [Halobacillus shinanisalinarum]